MLYRKIGIGCALLICCTVFAHAYDCTVITSQRDTIIGKFISADKTLTIHHTFSNRRLVLEPQQVHEFAITLADGTQAFYQFVTNPKTKLVKPMRRLVDGNLKLFEDKVEWVNPVNAGLPKGSSPKPTMRIFYISTHSEDATALTAQNWKNVLAERLSDCPLLLKNLGDKGYQFKNIASIIATYNVCHQRMSTRFETK